jgi:hypothetical protein
MIGGANFPFRHCLVLAGMWMIFLEAETREPVKQEEVVKAQVPQA